MKSNGKTTTMDVNTTQIPYSSENKLYTTMDVNNMSNDYKTNAIIYRMNKGKRNSIIHRSSHAVNKTHVFLNKEHSKINLEDTLKSLSSNLSLSASKNPLKPHILNNAITTLDQSYS
jgi:hypothetical protein